jgi:hypothetical protein
MQPKLRSEGATDIARKDLRCGFRMGTFDARR